jgi:hypothetical protein
VDKWQKKIMMNLIGIDNAVLSSPIFWKIVLNILLLKYTIPLELAEIKLAAKILFACVGVFLGLLLVKVCVEPNARANVI